MDQEKENMCESEYPVIEDIHDLDSDHSATKFTKTQKVFASNDTAK